MRRRLPCRLSVSTPIPECLPLFFAEDPVRAFHGSQIALTYFASGWDIGAAAYNSLREIATEAEAEVPAGVAPERVARGARPGADGAARRAAGKDGASEAARDDAALQLKSLAQSLDDIS